MRKGYGSGSSLRCSINNHTPLCGEQQATIYYDRLRCDEKANKGRLILLEKKYQFFVSSTYEDLKEERDIAIHAILTMNQFPVGMEML